jgi:hypothetical protein
MTEEPPAPALPRRRPSLAVKILASLAIVALILGGIWWWTSRPIKPVQLTPQEITVVEAKVEAIQSTPEATYEKGSKEIILTERELNGLLNENTQLGHSVSFQLARNAIFARVETDLDPGLPIIGGKRLKARARFITGGSAGQAALVLDDLTVWGISLPNDWLAGIKGRDLLGEVLGGGTPSGIPGVEEFRIEPGRLIIRLAE